MIGSDPRYQSIISAYRAGEFDAPYQAMDYTPSPYYNPIYDIRREQIKAGELEEGARFPKPLVDTKPKEEEQEEEQFDPCPPGYQLIDGVCQPDSMFQPSGGDGGERTEFESPYLGDIYTPMANDPINTELRRFAAQSEYQPTFGSSMQDLGRTLMQFSPVVGLLNAVGLGPSYTETVEPRESIQNVVAQQQAQQQVEANLLAQQAAEAERLRQLDIQRKAEAAAQVEKLRQQQALAAELERQRQAQIAAETERMRLAQQQAAEAERRRQLDIQRKQEAAAQQAAAEAARQAAAKQAAQEAFRKAQQSSSSRDRKGRTPSRTYAPSSGTTTGRTVRSTTGMLGGGV